MKYLLQFTLLLLGFAALTGIICGGLLLLDSSGGLLNLSYNFLSSSPFNSFFWPGLLVFVAIGCGGILACIITYKRRPNFIPVVYAYAILLLLFTIVQLYLTDVYTVLNTLYIIIAFLLILLAWLINSQRLLQHRAPASAKMHHQPVRSHHHNKRHKRR